MKTDSSSDNRQQSSIAIHQNEERDVGSNSGEPVVRGHLTNRGEKGDAPCTMVCRSAPESRAANDLSADARRQAVSILQLGCDRETAARFLGLSLDQFNRVVEHASDFHRDLARAEAAAEIAHMRSVQLAAKDPKNWRTSVWWLERMRPDVYKTRASAGVTKTDRSADQEK